MACRVVVVFVNGCILEDDDRRSWLVVENLLQEKQPCRGSEKALVGIGILSDTDATTTKSIVAKRTDDVDENDGDDDETDTGERFVMGREIMQVRCSEGERRDAFDKSVGGLLRVLPLP